MVFMYSFVANSPSVKFTLRMSHIGRVLELFVRWCLHLLSRTWTPASLTVYTKQARLSWTQVLLSAHWSVLELLWKMLRAWKKKLCQHICVRLHSEPRALPVFKFLTCQYLERTHSTFHFLYLCIQSVPAYQAKGQPAQSLCMKWLLPFLVRKSIKGL